MDKIRVSAVSYTNTKPFIYGLEKSGITSEIDLSLDIPSDCAFKLENDLADIGLIPVAALLKLPYYQIISDYCICATGAVDSVFIFSKKPIHEVRFLRLDSQSRTSNGLAKVLLKHHWKQQPEIVSSAEDAFVEIGDRTFGKKARFPYVYDLAEEWMRFCGLPFVFAVWAANKPIPEDFVNSLNTAFKFGLDHREEIISGLPKSGDFDLHDYLVNKIDFNLTPDKHTALTKYLDYLKDLE